MCALTLLASASSSRFLLHASSLQSGRTSEVNAIHLPSGDQTGPATPVDIFVCWFLSSPSLSIVHNWPPVTNAIFLPSGDQRGADEELWPLVSCFAVPPSIEIT